MKIVRLSGICILLLSVMLVPGIASAFQEEEAGHTVIIYLKNGENYLIRNFGCSESGFDTDPDRSERDVIPFDDVKSVIFKGRCYEVVLEFEVERFILTAIDVFKKAEIVFRNGESITDNISVFKFTGEENNVPWECGYDLMKDCCEIKRIEFIE